LSKHINEPPRPPSELVSGPESIPPGVDEVVLSCLAKNPEDRMQTMRQLGEAMEWSLEDRQTELVVLTDVPPTPALRWVWAAAGVAAVCLVALVVWAVGFRGRKAKPGGSSKATAARKESGKGGGTAGAAEQARPARLLKVKSQPEGAAIFRVKDGEYMGRTPADVQIKKGERVSYVVRLEGHDDSRLTLDFDTPSPVHVTLAAWKGARAGPDGGVKVSKQRLGTTPRKSRRRRRRPRLKPGDWGTVNPFKKK
jgi:hypothetical protein